MRYCLKCVGAMLQWTSLLFSSQQEPNLKGAAAMPQVALFSYCSCRYSMLAEVLGSRTPRYTHLPRFSGVNTIFHNVVVSSTSSYYLSNSKCLY